jgi:hypothetical protein
MTDLLHIINKAKELDKLLEEVEKDPSRPLQIRMDAIRAQGALCGIIASIIEIELLEKTDPCRPHADPSRPS